MKILIVDDSRAIQTIVRRSLEKTGFSDAEFRLANDGSDALSILDNWEPDLIITDWHMPGITGLEMLQTLRKREQGHRPLVGFVTTESVQERLQEATRHGAAFILHKPFTDAQLGDAVQQALERRANETGQATRATAQTPGGQFATSPAQQISRYLTQRVGQAVHLAETASVNMEALGKPWMIAFYSVGEKNEVRGFSVLDRAAMVLIGGSKTPPPPGTSLPADLTDRIGAMLGISCQVFFTSAETEEVKLLRSQLVVQAAPKLMEILEKKNGRVAFQVSSEGFSTGTLILIAR